MRVNKMIKDMLNNSLQLAFKELYGNQSGEFVCGYQGPSAWWPIEAGLLKFLASGPGQNNSDP